MIALLGVLFVDMVGRLGVPWPIAASLVMVLGPLLGLAHGLLITKLKMQPFVVTLCGLLIYRGIARGFTADATAGFPFGSTYPGLDFFVARYWGIPTSVFVFVVVAIFAWIVLHRSIFGRYLFAVGKNEEAARFSGIRTDVVITSAYVINAGLTALAAIFIAMYTRSVQPSGHANFYELYAIAAAVLGGFSLRGGEGSIIGVVLGTILLQVLQNLVNLLGIPSSLNFAVMGTVILIGVLADQQFGQYRERRRTLEAARSSGVRSVRPANPARS
jgi:ribose transport system permease protein